MKFAEFFAGAGLVREGLSSDQWECIWANDICLDKKETYTKNFGDHDFVLGDVWDVIKNPQSVPDDTFLYTASFPCTDLSVAGGRAGLAGEESGTLNAVLKLIDQKLASNTHPKVVMLENVAGFLTSHKGKDVADTVKVFSELGYFVDIIEADATLFTPQSRQRVFLIAVHESALPATAIIKDKNSCFDEWWSYFDKVPNLRSEKLKNIIKSNEDLNWILFDIPLPKKRENDLDSIIDTSIPHDSTLWWDEFRKEALWEQMNDSHKATLESMTAGQKYSYGTVYRRTRKGKSMAELRTDGIAGCLRTPKGGSSKQILIQAGYKSWSVRLLTPREYARLQGVRDSFILPENTTKGYFAMGDAVCVPVISYLSEHVLKPIYINWLSEKQKKIA